MKKLSKGIVVFAGLLAAPPTAHRLPQISYFQEDVRLTRLQQFFQGRGSPIDGLSQDFLDAADSYQLDWRLLPSIAVIESGGGKEYRNNNIFGWDSCKTVFPSVRAGIHSVARYLGESKLYKDKDLDELLDTYNTNGEYAERVKAVMEKLGPADLPLLQ